MYFVLLLLIFIVPHQCEFRVNCPNGRPAFWTFDILTFNFSTHCSSPGQSCHYKMGKCNKQHQCCPRTLR